MVWCDVEPNDSQFDNSEAVLEQQTFESMEQHFGQTFSPFDEDDDEEHD